MQINKYGEIIIDAFASATKIDHFVFTPAKILQQQHPFSFHKTMEQTKLKEPKKDLCLVFY